MQTATSGAPSEAAPVPDALPSAEESADWYVAVNDRQVGPLPAADVKTRWESGEIGPDTLAWRPGMSDWVALSTIPEMAQFLAPVPRGSAAKAAAVAAAVEQHAAAPQPAVQAAPVAVAAPAPSAHPAGNGVTNGAVETPWKPSAASALAALANEEIASLQPPKKDPAHEAKVGTLVDRMGLPEGGVDPTNLLPLPIRGLDTTTGESVLKPKAGSVRHAAPAPTRNARGSWGVGILVGCVLGLAIGGGWWFLQRSPQDRPQTVVAETAPVEEHVAPPVRAPVAPKPTVAATPAPAPHPVTAPEPAPAPAAAPLERPVAPPAVAAAPPVRELSPPVRNQPRPPEPARSPPKRLAPPPRTATAALPPPAPATAAHPAEPAPPPARKGTGDPILDLPGGSGDDLDAELSGKKPKRTVYVPPEAGSDLPDSVSVSQINEAVAGQREELLHCKEQQKASNSDAQGTLRVQWTIAGNGSVRDVRVLSDEFSKQPIAACITKVVKSTRFPRSRTTGQDVVFPFKF